MLLSTNVLHNTIQVYEGLRAALPKLLCQLPSLRLGVEVQEMSHEFLLPVPLPVVGVEADSLVYVTVVITGEQQPQHPPGVQQQKPTMSLLNTEPHSLNETGSLLPLTSVSLPKRCHNFSPSSVSLLEICAGRLTFFTRHRYLI